jgi:glycolate oxidase FAD binding subunit
MPMAADMQQGGSGGSSPLASAVPAPLRAACTQVRPADADDAVAGVVPRYVAAPAEVSEASALLRAAADLGLAVVPRGTGSRLHWGYPPARCDLVLETTRMNRVVEHASGDLVTTVQAGVRLEQLADVLGAAGQRLALDPPGGGTVGGVLATAAAGPLRLRYGMPRDLLIGITVVRADGTVARSGGKVVKNVAGYDIGKLFSGSRGTLGLITQATFRLHPLAAGTAYVAAECAAAADAAGVVAIAMESTAVPVSVELDWPARDDLVRVCVALEGDSASVAERAMALVPLLEPSAVSVSVLAESPAWWGAGPAARTDGTVLQIGFWPGDLGMVLTEIRAAAGAAGLDPAVGGSAAAGVIHVALPTAADPGAVASFVAALRDRIGRAHGSPARANIVVLHAPAGVSSLVDLFGPVPSLALMRAVKHQFDPAAMMAPGRFAGGI